MATLSILSGPNGPLTHVTVPLGKGVLPQRTFYGLRIFMDGLVNDLPHWQRGRLQAAQTPQEQMDALLLRWISGAPMAHGRRFRDLTPRQYGVWEMKAIDLRVFGWMYKPKVFIAAILDYADWYKNPTKRKTYAAARNRVVAMRDALDLDEPKFATGTYDALV